VGLAAGGLAVGRLAGGRLPAGRLAAGRFFGRLPARVLAVRVLGWLLAHARETSGNGAAKSATRPAQETVLSSCVARVSTT